MLEIPKILRQDARDSADLERCFECCPANTRRDSDRQDSRDSQNQHQRLLSKILIPKNPKMLIERKDSQHFDGISFFRGGETFETHLHTVAVRDDAARMLRMLARCLGRCIFDSFISGNRVNRPIPI